MGIEIAQYRLLLDARLVPGVELAAVRHDVTPVDDDKLNELIDGVELRKRLVRRLYARGLDAELRLEVLHDAVYILRLYAVKVRDRLHGEKTQRLGRGVARAGDALEHGVEVGIVVDDLDELQRLRHLDHVGYLPRRDGDECVRAKGIFLAVYDDFPAPPFYIKEARRLMDDRPCGLFYRLIVERADHCRV